MRKNKIHSQCVCGIIGDTLEIHTIFIRKYKIHSQCVRGIIYDTPGIHTIFIWKYKGIRMYALAICCMYAALKVEMYPD